MRILFLLVFYFNHFLASNLNPRAPTAIIRLVSLVYNLSRDYNHISFRKLFAYLSSNNIVLFSEILDFSKKQFAKTVFFIKISFSLLTSRSSRDINISLWWEFRQVGGLEMRQASFNCMMCCDMCCEMRMRFTVPI